jgi:hypothetical protein
LIQVIWIESGRDCAFGNASYALPDILGGGVQSLWGQTFRPCLPSHILNYFAGGALCGLKALGCRLLRTPFRCRAGFSHKVLLDLAPRKRACDQTTKKKPNSGDQDWILFDGIQESLSGAT